MKKAKDQDCGLGVGLKAQHPLECSYVVERLVHDREADDGVDKVGIDVRVAEHAVQQRRAMAHGEQRDVDPNFAHAIQEENHAEQKQQVVVSRNHVLCAQVHKRDQLHAAGLLDKQLVILCDAMGEGTGCHQAEQPNTDEGKPARTQRGLDPLMGKSHCKCFSHGPIPKSGARRRATRNKPAGRKPAPATRCLPQQSPDVAPAAWSAIPLRPMHKHVA